MAALNDILEKDFQKQVCSIASKTGWKWWHFHDSRRQAGNRLIGDKDAQGFPDLVLTHPSRGTVFAELKTMKGKLTGPQRTALDALAASARSMALNPDTTKMRVHLWRPDDLPDPILDILNRGKGPITYGW